MAFERITMATTVPAGTRSPRMQSGIVLGLGIGALDKNAAGASDQVTA